MFFFLHLKSQCGFSIFYLNKSITPPPNSKVVSRCAPVSLILFIYVLSLIHKGVELEWNNNSNIKTPKGEPILGHECGSKLPSDQSNDGKMTVESALFMWKTNPWTQPNCIFPHFSQGRAHSFPSETNMKNRCQDMLFNSVRTSNLHILLWSRFLLTGVKFHLHLS